MDLTAYTKQSNLTLTTTGRKTGKKYPVTVWFVVADAKTVFVQHVTAPANWCKNLAKVSSVELDFGNGAIGGRATVIDDAKHAADILSLFRRKYFIARFLQFFGRRHQPFVARIECTG